MAAKQVNAWRGILRGNLQKGKRVASALLAYHNKHDPAVGFLSAADVTTVTAFHDLCAAKLSQKKPR